MGKKLSEASTKISKNQKQQFSSMIKALRPKVYITHSSRFKKLVQELTGNNITSSSTTMSSSSSLNPEPRVDPQNCIITDHLETSFDSSEVSASSSSEATTTTTTSYSSSSEFCCYNQTCPNDTTLGSSKANQCMDGLLTYQNLESLLFDAEVEQSFLYDCYAQPEQEVSTYECELWGLL